MRVKLLAYIPSKDLINEVGEIPDVELLSHLAYVFAVEGISRVSVSYTHLTLPTKA